MAYPDRVLVDGERVLLHRHPHWRLLVVPVLAFLLTLGVAGYVGALARDEGGPAWGGPLLALVAVVAAGLVGWLTVGPVVRWRTTHLVVTTRRVLVREGVRRRQALDIPLDRIVGVRTHRTRPGRLVGCGSLVVTGVDGEVEFVDVAGAEQVRALLHRAAAP